MTDAEMCTFEHFLIEVCPLRQTYSIYLFPHDGSISVIMKTPRYERTLGAFIFSIKGTSEDCKEDTLCYLSSYYFLLRCRIGLPKKA